MQAPEKLLEQDDSELNPNQAACGQTIDGTGTPSMSTDDTAEAMGHDPVIIDTSPNLPLNTPTARESGQKSDIFGRYNAWLLQRFSPETTRRLSASHELYRSHFPVRVASFNQGKALPDLEREVALHYHDFNTFNRLCQTAYYYKYCGENEETTWSASSSCHLVEDSHRLVSRLQHKSEVGVLLPGPRSHERPTWMDCACVNKLETAKSEVPTPQKAFSAFEWDLVILIHDMLVCVGIQAEDAEDAVAERLKSRVQEIIDEKKGAVERIPWEYSLVGLQHGVDFLEITQGWFDKFCELCEKCEHLNPAKYPSGFASGSCAECLKPRTRALKIEGTNVSSAGGSTDLESVKE
ncbi:hypothetical protein DFH07DRAFT_1067172 [Mycena maculata]|uniref:Uncharacterized protein n=1 Tax=Mycena maculata TaxID=230809 RepID=A0AAD7HN86_9AGAR|nr:hypothetical protein DFH07DRAFT_1067172 [Mycena maculata]